MSGDFICLSSMSAYLDGGRGGEGRDIVTVTATSSCWTEKSWLPVACETLPITCIPAAGGAVEDRGDGGFGGRL